MERGERNIIRNQAIKLANYYHVFQANSLTSWVCEKVLNSVENEPFALKGMQETLKSINNINI